MKRAYTTFEPRLRRNARKNNLSPGEWVLRIGGIANNTPTLDGQSTSILYVSSAIDLMVMKGRCAHIFIPGREFCDWLVGCVKDLNVDHAMALQDSMVAEGGVGVLHFPSMAGIKSVAFYATRAGEFGFDHGTQDGSITVSMGKGANETKPGDGFFAASFSSDCELFGMFSGTTTEDQLALEGGTKTDMDFLWYEKLIVGLGMYCNCFPEVVRDGLPEDLKHPSHHQYNRAQQIGISEKISLGGTHASPTAHFRTGHFRVLQSEKFKNKRFQTIFIRETFVNGKAKTVMTPEETDQQKAA